MPSWKFTACSKRGGSDGPAEFYLRKLAAVEGDGDLENWTGFVDLAETNFYFLSASSSSGNAGAAFVIAFAFGNFCSNLFSAAIFRTSRAINRPHESSAMIATTTGTAILQPAFLRS
jgi:hypothetical protein